jgi:asparagine synthase (glutamine-hydrolysing)
MPMNIAAGIFCKTGNCLSNYTYNHPFRDGLHSTACGSHTTFLNSRGINIATVPDSGLFLIGDVSVYNTSELRQALHTDVEDAGMLVLKAYQKWGKPCIEHIDGDFMGAIWNEDAQELFCFRDRIGKMPFYYYSDKDVFIFSNKIQFLAPFDFANAINTAWVERFLIQSNTNADKEETPYTNIKKMLPASTITVTQNNETGNTYWQLKDKPQPLANVEEAVKNLAACLENSICSMLPGPASKVGAELSGGLDSSGIAAFIRKNAGDKLYAFSNVLPDEYKHTYHNFTDEQDKIETIKSHLQLHHHTYVSEVANDPFINIQSALDAVGYPTYMGINISQQPLYKKVQEASIHVLFSGFGGDEMLSANLYKLHVKQLINGGRFAAAANMINAHGHSLSKAYLSAFYNFIKYRFNFKDAHTAQKGGIVAAVLKNNFRHIPHRLPAFSNDNYIREWYTYSITSPGLVERLETGYHISQHYGIQYRYPLLDPAMLEYFYSLPDAWKLNYKFGRALFRKVLLEVLPRKIVESKKPVNTAVIPVIKIEVEKYFYKTKDYLLNLSQNHLLFDYVDRNKLLQVNLEEDTEVRMYAMLQRLVMLSMFFDKHAEGFASRKTINFT